MFKFLKKEESKETPEVIQSEDWTKDIKRSKKIGQEVEQLTFMYDSESPKSPSQKYRATGKFVKRRVKD